MEAIEYLYGTIGSVFCHQLPSRTLSLGGMQLPMCARDTGIYLGIFITIVFLYATKRFNADKPPELLYSLVLCISTVPMLFDGVSSYLGLRESNNVLRLITGIYFGSSLMFLLVPAANFKPEYRNMKPVLKNWREILVIAVINGVICIVLLRTDFLPWLLISTCIIVSFIYTVGWVIYIVLVRCRFINRKFIGLYVTGMTIAVLTLMLLVSHGVLIHYRR